jgi:Large polyvalent protein associated domain 38
MDVQMPDGTIISGVPDNITQSDLLRRYSLFSNPQKPEDVGIIGGGIAALKRGVESFGDIGAGYGLAGSHLFGNEADTAARMQAMKDEQEKGQVNPALSFADLQRIYKEQGIGAALGQVPKYAVEQFAESAPQMAVPLAVGEAAAALSGPFAPIVGPLAGIGAYGAQQFGSLMQRQGQEKQAPEDLSVGKAATAAAIQAPLGYFADRFAAGLGGLGEEGIIQVGKELAARKAAGEIGAAGVAKGIAKEAGKGAIEGFIAEAPTEALEQALERWQAGLPLADDKAKQEYLEAFMGAGVVGGAMGATSRGRAAYKAYKAPEEAVTTEPQVTAEPTAAPQATAAPLLQVTPQENPVVNQQVTEAEEGGSHDTQAMMDELNGKEITNAPSSTDTANQTVARTEPEPQLEPVAQPEPVAEEKPVEQPALEAPKVEEPKVEEKPVEAPKAEAPKAEAPPEVKAPEVKPQIAVTESAVTPTPVLNEISKAAVDAIKAANDYARQLTDSMPNAKDPDAHQNAIDRLNNTSNDINEKGQIAANELARTNNKTPGEQNRAILAAQKDLNKALIEHRKAVLAARKLLGNIKTKVAKPQMRKVRPAIEELPYPKTQEQMDLEERNKELDLLERRRARLKEKGGLFGALKKLKALSPGEIKDIGPDTKFNQLKSKTGTGNLSDLVSSGLLDAYLEPKMRHDSDFFDETDSTEHIKTKLRDGNYLDYNSEFEIRELTAKIEGIEGDIKELEDLVKEQLELKDVNLLIEEAADEQRRADQANQIYEPEHEAGVSKPGENELALKGETPEEVRAKEKAKEDRAKAEKEAEQRAEADKGVGEFTLTGSNRPADVAAARGQTGLFENIMPIEGEFEEQKKRSPSFKRAVTELNKGRNKGMLTDEEFALRVGAELEADNNRKLNKPIKPRERGQDIIIEKLRGAKRRGEISPEAVELAEWFMRQNPSLVDDLGISIKQGEHGTGGYYDNLFRVFTLMKNAGSDETPVHEILHHAERMMPSDIQTGIQKEWLQQLVKAQKNAKTDAEKVYFAALMDGHFGENRALDIEVKDKNGNVDKSVNKFLYDTIMRAKEQGQSLSSLNLAKYLLQYSGLPMSNYRFMNPSEFWAVNGSRIVAGDYAAIQGTRLDRLKNWLGKLAEKIKSLFGFRSDAPIIRALESLSKSDGKFQTKDMLGGGEYQNITKNYEGQPAPKSTWELHEDTKLDKFLHDWVDKYKEIKDVIKLINATGKEIDDRFNPYQKEELYHKKVATKIKMFLNSELRPIIIQMAKNKVSVAELEEFLHMRHAEERNEFIAARNPAMPDGGSGIETADARKYLSELAKDPAKEKVLNELGEKIDKMVYNNQEELVKGGIETQATVDALRKQFKHYVPLERSDVEFANKGTGLGAGFSTKGSTFKHAFGSTKGVVNIFENLALQRERSIIRSEKAVVGRALYGLALQNPNPKFWLPINPDAIKNKAAFIKEILSMGGSEEDAYNLMQEPKVAGFDKNGQVVYRVNPGLRNSPNVFPVRINGRDRYVFFNPSDAKAMRMAEALKNLDTEQLDMAMGTIGNITRMLAAVNTQYNPVFGLWNFARDTGGAAFNLTTTPIANKKAQVLKDTLPALKGIFEYLRDERSGKTNDPNYKPSKWAAIFKDYQESGGGVGFKEQFSRGKGDISIIEKEMKKLDHGNVRQVANSFFHLLSDYNDAMENAVRLSTYQTAIDQGLSKDQAASISKNITVNFNRKGAKTPYAAALYAFFNASVQGTSRLLETLKGPAGKQIMAGGFAVGVVQAMMLAAAGYDDDEPPEYLKDKNFVIPTADGNYILIPMPLGFNMFPGVGRIATESIFRAMGVTSGSESAAKKMTNVASLITDTFNPLGSGSLTQSLSPTITDPLLAVAQNKDAFGRPIYKEDRATNPTPGYTRSREGASEVSKNIAQFMNYVSGGDKYRKGEVSPTADALDYLAGQYGGGAAREAMKAVQYAASFVTGQEIPSYRVPLVGKMYGETQSPAAIQDKFYKNVTLMADHENEIKGLLKDRKSTAEYLSDNPEARLWSIANGFENRANAINKQRKMLIDRGAPQEKIDSLNQQKIAMMKQFNDRVAKLQVQGNLAQSAAQ